MARVSRQARAARRWSRPAGPALARLVLILLTGVGTALVPGRAGAQPAILGSPQLVNWLALTTAHALKAAEPDNDLRAGGLEALNRGVAAGLSNLDALLSPWLQRVDLSLRFDADLNAHYAVRATQPVYSGAGQEQVELLGALAYDPAGRVDGQLGFGYRGDLLEEDFASVVRAKVRDDWLGQASRYSLEAEFRWPLLVVRGEITNDVPYHVHLASAAAERVLDGYGLSATLRLPDLPWVRLHAERTWQGGRSAGAADVVGDRYSVRLQPWAPLEIETGTTGSAAPERAWFARLRLKLKLGQV